MKIADRAIIVKYHVASYSGEKIDNELGDELANIHEKTRQEASVTAINKVLGKPQPLEDCKKYAARIRQRIREMSIVPYTNGSVLIPYAKWGEFASECEEMAKEYGKKVDALIDALPSIIDTARLAKGNLLKEEHIPSAESLRSKFSFSIEPMPVPDSNNFDALLDVEGGIEKLKSQFNSDLEKVSERLNNHLVNTAQERLNALKQSIFACKTKLRDSTITKTRKQIQYLRDNNILENPRVIGLANRLDEIVSLPADSFSKEDVKQHTINKINQLLGV